ncbi:MAG TPA: hypothetical protein VH475_01035 [Tepidisphaeraceae bacterium]|jgi:hypothetical protein
MSNNIDEPLIVRPDRCLYLYLPTCKVCGSVELKVTKSLPIDPEDGTRTQYRRCKRCGERHIVLVTKRPATM